MAKEHGPTGTARGGERQPDVTWHGLRDGNAAGSGAGGMPPGDANNSNADSGFNHWHHLGSRKPPGYSISETHAADSGSNPKAKQTRDVKHDPAPGGVQPNRQVGKQTTPIGS